MEVGSTFAFVFALFSHLSYLTWCEWAGIGHFITSFQRDHSLKCAFGKYTYSPFGSELNETNKNEATRSSLA